MMRGRLWLVLPWLAFVAIVVGWIGYWHYVATQAEARLAAFMAQQNAGGAEASYRALSRHGFPVLLRLEIDDIAYASPRGGWRANTARADLVIDLLNPQHVILQARAPIAIARADGAVTNVNAQTLIASVRTERGALAVGGIEADQLTLDDPAQPGVMSIQKLVANMRPDPRRAGDYQLALEIQALHLPRPVRALEPLGQNVAALRAAVVIEQAAALLQPSPGDPTGAWRAAGGKLRFEALQTEWGPLNADARGEGGLDGERRIDGALELRVRRPGPFLNAIAEAPSISHDARNALKALALGFTLAGSDVSLHAAAHDGALTLEGADVRSLDPAY